MKGRPERTKSNAKRTMGHPFSQSKEFPLVLISELSRVFHITPLLKRLSCVSIKETVDQPHLGSCSPVLYGERKDFWKHQILLANGSAKTPNPIG